MIGASADASSDEDDSDDVRRVRHRRVRKNLLATLEDTINEINYDSLPPQAPKTFNYISSDKKTTYIWKTDGNASQGRRNNANIFRNQPGPSRFVKTNHPNITPIEAFELFITEDMIRDITSLTNSKIEQFLTRYDANLPKNNKLSHVKVTNDTEVRAFLGLMYIKGALKLNLRNTMDIFYHRSSNISFRATMSRNRFALLCRFIQFDDATTREERWKRDRFAAIREIFEAFNSNCAKVCIPSEYLAVDETLYPYRGHIKFKQYNPNKPAKYGILYRSISDSVVPCTYFTLPYAGKPDNPDQYYVTGTDNYTKYLVEGLQNYVDISGRNISMDRYFTSMPIASYLLDKNITLVGTMKANRIGIPRDISDMKDRGDLSTLYAVEEKEKFAACFLCGKKVEWKTQRSGTEHNAQQRKSNQSCPKKAARDCFLRQNERRSRCDGHDCWLFYDQIQDKALDPKRFSLHPGYCQNECSHNLQRHPSWNQGKKY